MELISFYQTFQNCWRWLWPRLQCRNWSIMQRGPHLVRVTTFWLLGVMIINLFAQLLFLVSFSLGTPFWNTSWLGWTKFGKCVKWVSHFHFQWLSSFRFLGNFSYVQYCDTTILSTAYSMSMEWTGMLIYVQIKARN